MNILMLNRFDIYSLPGTVRMVELSQQFVKKGHQVTLCYFLDEVRRKKLPLLRDSDPPGVKVIPLRKDKSRFLYNLNLVRQLAKNSDIVHFQKCFPETALLALWSAYLENKPIPYDWDDNETAIVPEWTRSNIIYHTVKKWENVLPKMVDSISYSTQYVKELAIQRGANPARLMHAPVGADIDRFHPSKNGEKIRSQYSSQDLLILYVGQLEGGSYAELFLQAAVKVNQKNPNTKFILVGGGHRLSSLQRKATQMGLNQVLKFTNYIPHQEIPDYVAAADVCVACFEDNEITKCKSPLKIAEYLAAGKPIVASGVGDVPQMINGAGIIVPPGDSDKLAEGILQILSNPTNLDEMKHSARQQADKYYNWSVIADNFINTYQKTISSFNQKGNS